MVSANPFVVWSIILTYMAIMAFTGIYYSRFIRTAESYFQAGRQVPWWAAGIAIYKANFTAYTFTGIASLVYIDGLSGLLLETGPAFAFLLAALLFVKRWYRLELTSPPEYLEARFNPLTRRIFSVCGILTGLMASGMRLYAVCKLVQSILGLPLLPTILIAGSVIALYTMSGGLWAVLVTDIIQFMILFLAAIPLFLVSVRQIIVTGGWNHFVSLMPAGFGTFPFAAHGRTTGWLLAFWFVYLLDYNGDWGVIQMICASRSEKEARKGLLLSTALAVPHAFLLLGPCFIARVLWPYLADPRVIGQAEEIYGRVAIKLLPIGMTGIVAAAMLAATMSTLSVSWSVRASSLVNDLYTGIFRLRAGDRERIIAGRISVLLVGSAATTIAALVAIYSLGLFSLAQSLVGIVVLPLILPLLLGLFLRGSNPWAGLAGMATGLSVAIMNRVFLATPRPFEQEVVISTLATAAAIVLVGHLGGSPADRARVKTFFARMQHPLDDDTQPNKVPPPGRVIGVIAMIVALLIILLGLIPQSGADRWLTIATGATFLAIGATIRIRSGSAPDLAGR